MLHPIDFFRTKKQTRGPHDFNLLREYLQVMSLQVLYRMNGSEYLRFGGGTCLRICHNLPRFSEDLDFSLDKKEIGVTEIIHGLKKGFKEYNVEFELSVPGNVDQKRVAKYWLKFPQLLHELGHSQHKGEKLNIKLEVDKYPPKKGRGEFFYVTKFEQHFPIFKSDLSTLFAGKIGAICYREYTAMRDFYDLLWYLNNGIEPNYEELNEIGIHIDDRKSLIKVLREKTKHVDGKDLVVTIEEFLENPMEKKVLVNYAQVFEKTVERYSAHGSP